MNTESPKNEGTEKLLKQRELEKLDAEINRTKAEAEKIEFERKAL